MSDKVRLDSYVWEDEPPCRDPLQRCIQDMSDDPVLFFEEALGIELPQYQKIYLCHYHGTTDVRDTDK